MVCRYYLGFLTTAFHTFFIVPSAAGSEPYCNRTFYGVPNYLACNTLLFGKGPSHSGGIASIDNVDHGFLLPYFGRKSQFTDWQWRHRVLLPEVWRSPHCVVALFVDINPKGGFFTDSARWSEIAESGEYLAETCKVGRSVAGGAGNAGTRGHLTITIFAPGSDFDRALTSGVERCELVAFDTSRSVPGGSAEEASVNLTQKAGAQGCQISSLSLLNVSSSYG